MTIFYSVTTKYIVACLFSNLRLVLADDVVVIYTKGKGNTHLPFRMNDVGQTLQMTHIICFVECLGESLYKTTLSLHTGVFSIDPL